MGLEEIQNLKGSAYLLRDTGGKITVPKAANKVSKKMKDAKVELRMMYTIFLSKHPNCEIKSPDCTGKAECVHHASGRVGEELMNIKNFMASCSSCNLYVEVNHKWAKEKGFKKPRHHKK